jgi:outer membrane protein assembly factor BamB
MMMMTTSCCCLLSLVLFSPVGSVLAGDSWCEGESCSLSLSLLQSEFALRSEVKKHRQGAAASTVAPQYFWPSSVGRVGALTSSKHVAPLDFSASLAWNWTDPRGRYYGLVAGAVLDDAKNIYLQTNDGVRKIDPDGQMLWEFLPERVLGEELPDTGFLFEGAFYVSTTAGWVYAISMPTGDVLWKTKLASTDGNNGWVTVNEGVVLTGSDAREEYKSSPRPGRRADQVVTGLNASSGMVLWNFKPDAPVWNFMGSFAGDGTFTFQDYEGKAYRCRLTDGSLIWKNGGVENSWTDGTSLLGPNQVVYTVSNRDLKGGRDAPGDVSAYQLEDGKLLWRTEVPRPPNNLPAVGQLAGRSGLSLVQPIGQQCEQGNPTDVYALDAETGEIQWIFNGPSQSHPLQAGDDNPIAQAQRLLAGVRPITLPNPWSAPTIDGNGIVVIGNQEGQLYALADKDGDGKVTDAEISRFDTKACFSGSAAAAIAPGMLVATSIDAMYVFKMPSS